MKATIEREGEAGKSWLANLGDLVRELCERWSLELDGPVLHGYLAIVIPVIRADEKLALKVSWIDAETSDEAKALKAWDGDGVVELIESDESVGALLLERLDYNTNLETLDPLGASETAGRLLRRLAIPAPAWATRIESQADEMASKIKRRFVSLDHSVKGSCLDKCLILLKELERPDHLLLVNQDLHFQNVLAATREEWLVIDPKVCAGDLEFGTAQLLWQDHGAIKSLGDLSIRLDFLTDSARLDRQKMKDWTYVRLVDLWLWGVGLGFTEIPERCKDLISFLDQE